MLKTGGKPAPGELIIIQGLVNTLDIETGTDDIGTRESLKEWLVRHGLLRSGDRVSAADQKTALSLREALRSLLLANNGEKVPPSALKQLNRLLSKFPLAVTCDKDGKPSLSPYGRGMTGVFGLILSQVVLAVNEGTWSRLKACRESNCRWAFYDGSRNHSGRWCLMSVCGSRVKARAYRRRRSAKEQKPGSRQKNSDR
jgi:predicted RNA-binding Zn ribbon-like protein